MKVFWSYAKLDDPKPHNVTLLRETFASVLGQCLGEDFELFQDTTGIKWGNEWRKKLESEVVSSNAFVCVLSPSYFKSKICMRIPLKAATDSTRRLPPKPVKAATLSERSDAGFLFLLG